MSQETETIRRNSQANDKEQVKEQNVEIQNHKYVFDLLNIYMYK